jgi:hypothetical protein
MFRSFRKGQSLPVSIMAIALVFPLSVLAAEQSGVVKSGTTPIAFSNVTLYEAGTHRRDAIVLGKAQSDGNGYFTIFYKPPHKSDAVLYLIADGAPEPSKDRRFRPPPSPIRLATVLGTTPVRRDIVINERTTVATAYAMAQFIEGHEIGGKRPGLQNAAATVRNLVNLNTGEAGLVLRTPPNGNLTSALPSFNSLANMLAACVQTQSNCTVLFDAATTPGGETPRNTLQAIVNIAHNSWRNVEELFDLSLLSPVYTPFLTLILKPDAWTLALRYNGDGPLGQRIDGPGNIAFDKEGNAWVTNNYRFGLDPSESVCGSNRVLKLTPTGGSAPGAPYRGGGLYGAGYGITLDPDGDVWVGNFGFQGQDCPLDFQRLSQSVSKFSADGEALSPAEGFFKPGLIAQPQGTVSDRKGNIWIANCAGDSVTQFPRGNPDKSVNFGSIGVNKPFAIAIDTRGHAWVTSNANNSVVELGRDGVPVGDPIMDDGLRRPMGIATDSFGNLWVSSSGVMDPPCPTPLPNDMITEEIGEDGAMNEKAAVTLIRHRGQNRQVKTFGKLSGKRDGLRLPWGIAVDGNDNIFVANFAGQTLMQLCGVVEANCPPGVRTGDPISPDSGYTFDGLVRNTAVQIDPSGNVWLTNNWILDAFKDDHQNNPGGHELVVFIGLAAPIKTPLIGPPQRP